MANIDVTALLCDPDFVDKIQLIVRTPTTDQYGQGGTQDVVYSTIGSVQPSSARTIDRLPEALRQGNIESFWIKGLISDFGAGKYPSVLVFKNKRYQIRMVFDWTNFGLGWSEGVCVAEVPA